jgi:hypothetical protein
VPKTREIKPLLLGAGDRIRTHLELLQVIKDKVASQLMSIQDDGAGGVED